MIEEIVTNGDGGNLALFILVVIMVLMIFSLGFAFGHIIGSGDC